MELEGAVGEVANVAVEEQAEQAQIAQAQAQQAAEGGHTYTELRAPLCGWLGRQQHDPDRHSRVKIVRRRIPPGRGVDPAHQVANDRLQT